MGAKQRFGTMLNEMLFSLESSTEESPKTNPSGERNLDEECGNSDKEDVKETTGLLTGEPGTSLTNNLRPSIFTTISEQQSMEEKRIQKEPDSDSNKKNERGTLDSQEGLDDGTTNA